MTAARLEASLAAVAASGAGEPVVRIVVLHTDGSTPREAGAAMLVERGGIADTVGGGRLELEAIGHARALLAAAPAAGSWPREVRSFALGPSLGQCCGGSARLLFEVLTRRELADLAGRLQGTGPGALALRPTQSGAPVALLADRKGDVPDCPLPVLRAARDMLSGARPRGPLLVAPGRGAPAWFIEPVAGARTPLFVYGAGHVGRAIVHVLNGLPFDVRWVDTRPERFPEAIPAYAAALVSPDPAATAAAAPAGALHLVLTYSHALDLAIVHALLGRADFRFLGLIGSETKAARFRARLRQAGVAEAALARLTCPIGISALRGKEPPVIAVAVAAQLIETMGRHVQQRDLTAKVPGA
ncbi:MAG: xanthine dehydrogenase accessory protein XdhC [Hyphomicrobiaceae bacterium]|nr:xanthine dehydrogenase accessory protein XdhC [Hyphomicrobiaceae bacterium]